MHSNKDLATTTPLVMHHDREAARHGEPVDGLDGGGPEHGETAQLAKTFEEELDEMEPGPSDVNGG